MNSTVKVFINLKTFDLPSFTEDLADAFLQELWFMENESGRR
jgi:hypothetical protein